jgi:hypothetical protein
MRTEVVRRLALGAALALASSGCVRSMMRDQQVHAARASLEAADTIADYELARSAAAARIEQIEALHRLAPDDEGVLLLLARGWTVWGHAFAEDDREAALLAGDEEAAGYHGRRAKLAYDRAVFYGLELLSHEDEGFAAARKSAGTLRAWLERHFDEQEDAEPLLWLGTAWLGRARLVKDDPEIAVDAYVGVGLLERSRALWPELRAWSATASLGAWHARSPKAELDEAKRLLDRALEETKRRSLPALLDYAALACARSDQALYETTLNEILAAEDTDPTLRLPNVVAKRRAKRALSKHAMSTCGSSSPPAR